MRDFNEDVSDTRPRLRAVVAALACLYSQLVQRNRLLNRAGEGVHSFNAATVASFAAFLMHADKKQLKLNATGVGFLVETRDFLAAVFDDGAEELPSLPLASEAAAPAPAGAGAGAGVGFAPTGVAMSIVSQLL